MTHGLQNQNCAGAFHISCEACAFQVVENETFSVDECITIISEIITIIEKDEGEIT